MHDFKSRVFAKQFITILVLGLFITNGAVAQVKVPQITPLSPNAASLWKFNQFPVNMYTGIPNISIPLYEIKSGTLTIPVSLNYHAGGNRYEDQASWVGLGWNLNAGGAVNRNVKGKADEKQYVGLFTQTQPLNLQLGGCELEYFTNINNGNIDSQPDEFTYSIPGKSGRFMYRQTIAEPLIVPYEPLKITKTYSPNNLSGFQIIDGNGTTYRFGNNKLLNNPVIESTSGGLGSSIEETMPYPGSWLLTEMESADATDVISFKYVGGESVQKNSKASSLTVTEQLSDVGVYGGSISYGSIMDLNFSFLTNTKYLSEIIFENGKVEFVQTSWYRTDLYNNQKALEAINVYSKVDGVYILVKKIVFTYTYFERRYHGVFQDWKLKLNKVEVFGKNDDISEVYSFEYHTDNFSGDNYYSLPYALDYWGFYNGKTSNNSLIPVQTFSSITSGVPITTGNADRSVDPAFLKEGVLKKIVYPTGGYSIFEYEPHQYFEDGILKLAGGLRVNRITTTESASNGMIQEKMYKYGLNEQGDGFKNFYNNFHFYRSLVFSGPPATASTTISSTQSFQLDGFEGSPVVYPYVTEYFGNVGSNIGKIKYVYDDGSPAQDNLMIAYQPYTNLFFRKTNHWKRGFLTKKTVFDKSDNAVSVQSSNYQIIHPVEEIIGLNLQKKFFDNNGSTGSFGSCYFSLNDSPHETYFVWHKAYIPFSTGAVKILNSTENIYDYGDPIQSNSNETNYLYDPNYLQPIEVTKTLRKLQTGYEEQVTEYTKYPFNYSFTSIPSGSEALGIKLLQDKNISAAPVEQYTVKKYRNPTTWQSDITAGTITTYRSDKPYPDKIWQIETAMPLTQASFGTGSSIVSNAFSKNTAYKEKLAFTGYDATGNITQYNKVNDIANTYLWDYLNTYPVAEVTNAGNTSIAYTSFEAEGKGNWAYNGAPAVDATAPTGKKAYTLNGINNLIKTGLSTGTTYIVSYWIKNTTPLSITGTVGSATAGRSFGLWKYYEHRVTGQTQVTITGSSMIDELRLYPVGALMTTYTHEPLIGLSSKCDAGNRISYYEYDAFGRLQLIRDQDKNILKTFEYKYKTP